MTQEGEDVRVREYPQSPVAQFPRLFSDAETSAVEGAFAGDEGVGEAASRGTGEGPFHGGADFPAAAAGEVLRGLLDPASPGVRGARPASRAELAELILRYRDEQASRSARRLRQEASKPRFSAEQRLL